jgi:hypothetical protein
MNDELRTAAVDQAALNVAPVRTAFALPSVTVQPPTELEALHRAAVKELKDRANVLLTESARRIRRYQWTKLGSATLLLGSLLGMVYSNSPVLGLETLALRFTPVALFAGLLFYLAEQYFKDHEVASRATVEGEKLLNAARYSEAAWTLAEDTEAKKKVVKGLMDLRIDTTSIIAAERAGKLSDLVNAVTEYSQALIKYREDKVRIAKFESVVKNMPPGPTSQP